MAWRERDIIRLLHLVLSVPILGFLYGPVAHIARAAWFTRWVAFPTVVLSGLWLWLKPKVIQRLSKRAPGPVVQLPRTATAGSTRNPRGASVAHAYGRK